MSNRTFVCGGVQELETFSETETEKTGILKSPSFELCTNASILIRKADMNLQREYMAVVPIQPSI